VAREPGPRIDVKSLPRNAKIRQLRVRCGTSGCHCMGPADEEDPTQQAHWHGPYWYAEWRLKGKGRVKTAYIGRDLF